MGAFLNGNTKINLIANVTSESVETFAKSNNRNIFMKDNFNVIQILIFKIGRVTVLYTII